VRGESFGPTCHAAILARESQLGSWLGRASTGDSHRAAAARAATGGLRNCIRGVERLVAETVPDDDPNDQDRAPFTRADVRRPAPRDQPGTA
jgi:hypothetical protein